jgi:hypothetical protein
MLYPPPQTELPDDVRLGSDPPRYDPVLAKSLVDQLIGRTTAYMEAGSIRHVSMVELQYRLKTISAYLTPRDET